MMCEVRPFVVFVRRSRPSFIQSVSSQTSISHFSIWENLDVLEESYQFIDACFSFQEHGM